MSDIALGLLRKITKGNILDVVLRTAHDFKVENDQFTFRVIWKGSSL